jgi:hypothetical protein
VSTIVALPILFYTSWELYQRGTFFSSPFFFLKKNEMADYFSRAGADMLESLIVYGEKTQKHLIDKTKRTVEDEKRNGV